MSNNFNSQKFTSLKKIKPQKTEQSFDQEELAQTSEESDDLNTSEEQGHGTQSSPLDFTFPNNADHSKDEVALIKSEDNSQPQKSATSSTPQKKNFTLDDEKPEKTPEEKKENNMFWWMMVMFILAAPASIAVVYPAIPFYLTAFILAILLIRRINKIAPEERTKKQKRRKGLAIWVLVQWAVGLGIFGLILLY